MGNFPENLRNVRTTKGFTLRKLAELTGLDATQICHYEKGVHFPSIIVLEWLCEALGVSSKDLLGF